MNYNLDSSFVRDQNRLLILTTLRERRHLTRAELAQVTNLSYPTVSTILKELEAEGLLTWGRESRRGSGRRPMGVEFVPHARLVAGLDLNATTPRVVLADLDGTFTGEPVEGRAVQEASDLLPAAEEAVKAALDRQEVAPGQLLGVGIALRGTLDLENETVYFMEFEQPVKLVAELRERLGVPVVLDHNYNAALLAEHLYGAANCCRLVFRVNVGTGISAGLLVNGEIYRGAFGNAGEFGHVSVDPTGPVCEACGRRGCLELYASARAIAQSIEGAAVPEDEVDRVVGEAAHRAAAGEEAAREVFTKAAWALAEGLTDAADVLNPEMIIVDGSVTRAYPHLVEEVRSRMARMVWPPNRRHLKVETSRLEGPVMLRGAVALILREVFRIPAERGDRSC